MEMTRRTPAQSREDRTRASIVTTARRLIQRHGLAKVTMDDIAAGVGRKKSFLYYYYPGRRELLQAVIEAELLELQEEIRSAVHDCNTAADALKVYLTVRFEAVLRRAAAYGADSAEALLQGVGPGTDFTQLLELRRAFDAEEGRFLASLLRRGINDGLFQPLSKALVDETVRFLLFALRGIEYELALAGDTTRARTAGLPVVIDIFLRGLAAG